MLEKDKPFETSLPNEEPLFITRKRAAFLLSCSVQSIDLMIRAGTLERIYRGRKALVSRQSLQKWIDAEREKEREKLRARDQAEKVLKSRWGVQR